MTRFIVGIAGVIFLALSCLLYVQVYRHVSPIKSHTDIDSPAYLERAELFCTTNTFARPGEQTVPYFTLGYPLIMGLIFKLFGLNKIIIIWFQVLLALITGLLLVIISRRLFNNTVAGITALFFAGNLGFLVFSQFILTEICLVFFLVLFFERFSYFLQVYKFSALMTAGVSLGLSVIIKPAALYFPILLLPLISNKKMATTWLFLFSFILPIMSYSLHNNYIFGSYKLGSLDQVNLYFWFFPHVLAQENGTNSDIERAYLARLNNHDPSFAPVKKLFWQKFKHNPVRFIFVWLKNVFKTAAGLYTTNLKVLVDQNVHGGDISFFRINGTIVQKIQRYITAGTSLTWVKTIGYLEAFWSVMRYILCLIGLFGLFYTRRYIILYFFSSYLFYFAMITGHDGCARFRMLFEFVLLILAAYGLLLVTERIKHVLDMKKKERGYA